jgi:hypothetical protein
MWLLLRMLLLVLLLGLQLCLLLSLLLALMMQDGRLGRDLAGRELAMARGTERRRRLRHAAYLREARGVRRR